jgi:hypothetical protein
MDMQGHNGGPPLDDEAAIMAAIDDLYAEAKNWADGEPISSQEVADAITKLHDGIHDLGKRGDELRIEEKRPHDEAVQAVQDKWNPYVQPKKGRVAVAKAALGELLTAWRTAVAKKAEAEAAAKRAEAAALADAAEAAIRASSGNLEAREQAEVLLKDAKQADRWAGRAERKAMTGTGLRTVWQTTIADEEAALTWAYEHAPDSFIALALSLAETEVRVGKRKIAGFDIKEVKVAT